MVTKNDEHAEQLVRSLPHIKKLRGKTVVVKYGGNAMINGELKTAVVQDIMFMSAVGIRVLIVHGGGPEIDAMLKTCGKESRFVDGLRYTDEQTMDIVQMVLCGKVNKDICTLIQNEGGNAIGLCGIDGALLQAVRVPSPDLGLVGDIQKVNTGILENILSTGAIPVISPVAMGIEDAAGHSLNVNADTAAANIAAALCAEKLVLITDVLGIMRNVHDKTSLISNASVTELETLKKDGILSKGMIPKADCCTFALANGVKKAHIIDGRIPHSLLTELFTDEGIGTLIE